MAVVTCTFNGIVGVQIVRTLVNGDTVYVVYDDGTDTLKTKRISFEDLSTAQTIAISVTDVS